MIEKVHELDQEKMKTEKAFHDFLPQTIVRDIKLKKVSAENFECVTIFFGDIVGFNDLTNDCSAVELIDFMNHFYCNLDTRLEKFQVITNVVPTSCQVYNVHTMKDEFMIVSGMPERNGQYWPHTIHLARSLL